MNPNLKTRTPYGSTRRRIVVCADKTTEKHVLETKARLTELTGSEVSLSAAIAYLVREGHKASLDK